MKRASISLAVFVLLFSFPLAAEARADGSVPIAENIEFSANRNAPTAGQLQARDADNDVSRFVLTTKPRKGELILAEDGGFLYTPRPNRKGRDYFGFRVIDDAGNVSQEATGLIRIET